MENEQMYKYQQKMIPGILQLNSKTIYGFTSRNVPIYRFKPLDTTLPDFLVGCSHRDRTKNMLGLVEPSDKQRTNLIRLIGECGNLQYEKEALCLQYSKNTWKKFDKTTINQPLKSTRVHLNGYTFNVDPIGCTDIDDAITIGNDGYIYITIADVGSWMVTNPTLFKKASTIGQTLYENGKVVSPLLPIEEECSLLPGKERLGIALKFKWTGMEIQDTSFEKVSLTNTESFTYDSIYSSTHAALLKEIASHLAKEEINDSHKWIEQFMIFYNCEVAKVLHSKQIGILRSQDEPDIEKLNFYKTFVDDISYLANKSAKYTDASNKVQHWGLGVETYCHATSPIRRFADIVNQLALCEYTMPNYDIEELNRLQKQSKKYERDLFFLEKLLGSESRHVQGIVLNDHRIWVPEWKRIVTCKNDKSSGTTGTLKYSLDMNQVTWKRRMVFRFEDTNCPE
jgi:exoribonuclease R